LNITLKKFEHNNINLAQVLATVSLNPYRNNSVAKSQVMAK